VIPDVMQLVALLKPLVHHDPLAALAKAARGGVITECDELAVPGFMLLSSSKRARVKALVGKLVAERLLEEELLLHLSCWKDLGGDERRDALCLMRAFDLLVEDPAFRVRGAAPRPTWLLTCRLDEYDTSPPPLESAGNSVEAGILLVQYPMAFIPMGLFPFYQALQLTDELHRLVPTLVLKADSISLDMKVQSVLSKEWGTLSARVVNGSSPSIEIECSSVALLNSACAGLERLMHIRFPGLVYESVVYFCNDALAPGVLRWRLDRSQGSLAAVLARRDWNLKISVDVISTGAVILASPARNVVGKLVSLLFFSHCWQDRSVDMMHGFQVCQFRIRGLL
jgi:hypothetical protein